MDEWREVYRTPDRPLAETVLTTIVSMEFDARLRAVDAPPFVVEVRARDHADLADVVAEIVDEQAEFDVEVASRRSRSTRAHRLLLVCMTLAMLVLVFLAVFRR